MKTRQVIEAIAISLLCITMSTFIGCQTQGKPYYQSTGESWAEDTDTDFHDSASNESLDNNMRYLTLEEHAEGMARHYCDLYERIERIDTEPLDDRELSITLGCLDADESYHSIKVLIAHVADADLRELIVEKLGKKQLERWQAEKVVSKKEGLEDFLTSSFGTEYVERCANTINSVLEERDR